MKTNESAQAAAVRLLSMRAYSRAELSERLSRRGYAPDEAASALDRLEQLGYIDEEAYAESLVRRYAAKGYGVRAIPAQLRAHGLPSEAIDRAMSGYEPDGGRLSALAQKLLRGDGSDASRRRVTAALLRRGFPIHEITAALNGICGARDRSFDDE